MSIPPVTNSLSTSEQIILEELQAISQRGTLTLRQEALANQLEQICQNGKDESAIAQATQLVINGARLYPQSCNRNTLFYWLCKTPLIDTQDKKFDELANKRIDLCIRRLITDGANINAEDTHGKIPFDYYLETGKNLSTLLNNIPLPKRAELVSNFPQIPESNWKYIPKGDLMLILTIGSHYNPNYSHRLLYTGSSLEFLTGNLLKTYAQLIKHAIDSREKYCAYSDELDLVVLMKDLIGRFSFHQQKEFMRYIEEFDGYYLGKYLGKENEICVNRQLHYGTRITKCFLHAFPEFTSQRLLQKIAEISAKIGTSEFESSITVTPNAELSLSERVIALSKIDLESPQGINELTEKATAVAIDLNKAKTEVQKLIETASMSYFWDPQDTLDEARNYLQQKQIVVESLLEKMKKIFQSLHHNDALSTTGNVNFLYNPE